MAFGPRTGQLREARAPARRDARLAGQLAPHAHRLRRRPGLFVFVVGGTRSGFSAIFIICSVNYCQLASPTMISMFDCY